MSAAKASKSKKSTKSNLFKRTFGSFKKQINGYLKRRPHRSFRRTRRRDYTRSLKLPGYWAFTDSVRQTLWKNKKLFAKLILTYAILTAALVGIASQEAYLQVGQTLSEVGGEVFTGGFGRLAEAGLLLMSGLTGTLNASLTGVQQVYSVLITLLIWLTTVWLLRATLAGGKPKLRDGLYNSMTPLLSTFLVALVLVVQLIPIGLGIVAYSALSTSGLLQGGVEAMLFWSVAALLALLSVYWVTSTFIALVVVTLPGMYPWQAIKTAGDLVIGRRLRILLRLLWLGLIVALVWVVIMIPVILFDQWVKGLWPTIEWLPVVPLGLLIMSSVTIVWVASYIYLLYRKVVEDDVAPA